MRLIAEGAESKIYQTTLMEIDAVLKRRIEKDYRIKEIDGRIIETRSKSEARIIAMASSSGVSVPRLLLCDGKDIYMSRISGRRLDDHIKMAGGYGVLAEVGVLLGSMHNLDISHGDYTPANIIVSGGKPFVIDFGLSEVTSSVEEKALDVLLMKRSLDKRGYVLFLKGYARSAKKHRLILSRLEKVERRGRYQTRTLAV